MLEVIITHSWFHVFFWLLAFKELACFTHRDAISQLTDCLEIVTGFLVLPQFTEDASILTILFKRVETTTELLILRTSMATWCNLSWLTVQDYEAPRQSVYGNQCGHLSKSGHVRCRLQQKTPFHETKMAMEETPFQDIAGCCSDCSGGIYFIISFYFTYFKGSKSPRMLSLSMQSLPGLLRWWWLQRSLLHSQAFWAKFPFNDPPDDILWNSHCVLVSTAQHDAFVSTMLVS